MPEVSVPVLVLVLAVVLSRALPVVVVVLCATIRPGASPAIARALRGLAEVDAARRPGARGAALQPWWSWRAASVREPDSDG